MLHILVDGVCVRVCVCVLVYICVGVCVCAAYIGRWGGPQKGFPAVLLGAFGSTAIEQH